MLSLIVLDVAILTFISSIYAVYYDCDDNRVTIFFIWPILYVMIVLFYLFAAYVLWSDKRNGHL